MTQHNDRAVEHSRAVIEILFGPSAKRPFDVRYWDGSIDRGSGVSRFALVVRRPGALRRMLLPPSELSIVEAYLSGDVDVEGELEDAVTLGDAINAQLKSARRLAAIARHLVALPKRDSSVDVTVARAERTVAHSGHRHDEARDRSAIQYHYDVGNDFYSLWLDDRMVYSCAYFRSPTDTLEDAQLAKIDLVCRKLRLKPGDRLLDVGCGWGALIMHAARAYGASALGITLSEAQAKLARDRIDAAGLQDRARVELRDYRELGGQTFDKISSIGMIEHVGAENLPVYFRALHAALEPRGVLLNHGIVNVRDSRPKGLRERLERKVWRRDAFIDQYVFPDGKLAPFHAVIGAAEAEGFETRDVESLREHYVLTLREWLRRLTDHAEEAVAATNERLYRTWRLYMTASAQGFASGRINVVQTLFVKPDDRGSSGIPLRRDDLLAPGFPD